MIEDVFTKKFLLLFMLFLFIAYSVTKIADFYGIDSEVYMIYMYFYGTLFIFYVLLPHKIAEI